MVIVWKQKLVETSNPVPHMQTNGGHELSSFTVDGNEYKLTLFKSLELNRHKNIDYQTDFYK